MYNNSYPRPQLRRTEWISLNGEWTFNGSGTIYVPYCPESELSGVPGSSWTGKELIYEKKIEIPAEWRTGEKHVILHVGAADQKAKLYVNDRRVCSHIGGYLPWSADITEYIEDGNTRIRIEVTDDLDHRYPWGKQKIKRGGMWYTPVSGIWQSVWMEAVPKEYIESVRIDCGLDWVEIAIEPVKHAVIELLGRRYEAETNEDGGCRVRIEIENPVNWTPENPHLYECRIVAGEDAVESYFALRTLSVEERDGYKRLCLNGEPYFFNGLLDQGYWQDGIYTPKDPDAYEKDILAMKSLGFNTLRKHIKIEPEQFYYDCDRLGMVVFQDMVNNGNYSFFRDSVLPIAGVSGINDRKTNRDEETRRIFIEEMEKTVEHLRNHPSICYWTIFNEGWGQFCADEAYERLRAIDSSRFIDSTSGWFAQEKSDVDSHHIYFRKIKLEAGDKPLVLSEFGGYACKLKDHCFNPDKTYGYRKCGTEAMLLRDLVSLYEEQVLPLVKKGLCAAIYTQISDVEDETNGFFTYDREVLKVKAYSASGRIELIGNHTDHQGGMTLVCPTKERIRAYAADNHEDIIRVFSEVFEPVEINILEESYDCEKGTERALVAGVISGFRNRFGSENLAGRGCDIYVSSEIPIGIGIASSAAFEVLIGRIVNDRLYGGQASSYDIACIGRYAENEFYGKPCGLMDQLAVSLGTAALMDFGGDELKYEAMDFNPESAGCRFRIYDTRSSHAGRDEEYASVPADMFSLAGELGASRLGDISREDYEAGLEKLRVCGFTERQLDRGRHYYAEIERVKAGADALKSGDIERFIKLVDESGRSSENVLRNIVSESEASNAVSDAITFFRESGQCRAVKIQGGGFGGSLLIIE